MPAVHYSHKEDRYWVRDGDGIAWFDGPLEAQEGAKYIERRDALRAEAKAIADWLDRMGYRQIALAIRKGDYRDGQ